MQSSKKIRLILGEVSEIKKKENHEIIRPKMEANEFLEIILECEKKYFWTLPVCKLLSRIEQNSHLGKEGKHNPWEGSKTCSPLYAANQQPRGQIFGKKP